MIQSHDTFGVACYFWTVEFLGGSEDVLSTNISRFPPKVGVLGWV